MSVTNQIKEYVDDSGRSPFGEWFEQLNPQAATKVATAIYRLEQGNSSNSKSLGGGVYEIKINFGPGYRVYYGWDGRTIVILIAGGTKKGQSTDVKKAKGNWSLFKSKKEC